MKKISMRQAINDALHIAFDSDDKIFSVGEDIAEYGGQLRCSYGLYEDFGSKRIMDTPISENAIMGIAIGSSILGLRPVIELSYIDFIGVCFDQIMNQAAKLRYMYGGNVNLPLVIRTQEGAGLGNGAQHSQCLESLVAHIPGIRVVMPSNAYDAKGLLLHAIRDNNPVMFIEHKRLYKRKMAVPEEPYECSYDADIKREGTDLTIIAYSAMVDEALKASEKLADKGISTEVIDIRCLEPLDIGTIINSVKKTGKVIVAHEACVKGGFGAEIVSQIQQRAFKELKKPIQRVGAPNVPVPFSPILENEFVPDCNNILDVAKQII